MQFDVLPPYTAAASTPRHASPSITALPLHLLHRIFSLTLDPLATPSRFSADPEEERLRRVWALFRGLRCVNRRFYLVATSILRTLFLPLFLSQILPDLSSDPFPHESIISPESEVGSASVFASRGRETGVFDRFIAMRVGDDLRRAESELSEGGEGERDLFQRFQPAARIEDLLLTLPSHLVSATTGSKGFPLAQSHLSVNLTPAWAQLYLSASPVNAGSVTRKMGRELAVEVRRGRTAEATVRMFREGLTGVREGSVALGGRVG